MHRHFNSSPYFQSHYVQQNEERFIWPIVPFLGGALVGYIAGRPQYNYPQYYPVYYPPYYNNYYFSQPYNQ